MALRVTRLTLTEFRNYRSLHLTLGGESVIITGENGAGKTNLLEAVSLLMPGRGLRHAKLGQMQHQPVQSDLGWGVAMQVQTPQGIVDFGTGQQPGRDDKRILHLDGGVLKNQSELTHYFAVLWQTPQMDGLFTQGQSERRHYFDRLASVFIADHAAQIAKYDYLRRERARLLALPRYDAQWIHSLEQKMAETSLAIAATRLETLVALQHALEQLHSAFPKARIALHGFAETALQEQKFPAIEIEEKLVQALQASRMEDAQSGRASHGAHKTEMEVVFAPKGVEAAYCSTGEQKALMLSLLLAQAQAMKQSQHRLPILLLDEVVAHLDESRRKALFETLSEIGCQSWMTGTDSKLFTDAGDYAHYTARASEVQPV